MIELVKQYWWLGPVVSGLFMIILRYVKSDKFQKLAGCGVAHGILLDKFATLKIGKFWVDYGEKAAVTLIDTLIAYFKNVKIGMLQNNTKVMVKKKLDNTDEFKALKQAEELLKKKD